MSASASEVLVEPSVPRAAPRADGAGHRLRAFSSGLLNTLWPLAVLALAWEVFARSGRVPRVLTPTLGDIFGAMTGMASTGILFVHVGSTLARLLVGFTAAAIIGVTIGIAMARWRLVERFFQPIVSVLLPIPGLAWVPIFILWFGLGELPTILLVTFVSTLPIVVNTWTGVKTTSPILIRAAQSMNADGMTLFRLVILPAALPFILTGFRIGLAQSFRTVVAGEFIANTAVGLGWVIFNSIAFLKSDVMFASIVLIGLIGVLIEKVAFEALERRTVARWGMLHEAGGS